jgi:uncharacterized membrane protein
MAETFERFAAWIALGVEMAAAILIAGGAVEALVASFRVGPRATLGGKKLVWIHFARWLVLGLEFELAADIIRTAISPTWDDIGQLAAIAVIRTFLNYFLEKDIKEFLDLGEPAEPAPAIAEAGGRAVSRSELE